jgi:hypothetical protein
VAHRAIWQCVAAPKETLKEIKARLLPVGKVAPDTIAQLIRELDDDDFEIRERASRDLRSHLEAAEASLRLHISLPSCSAEQRRRVQALLPQLEQSHVLQERAVTVLEHLETGEARQLLESLAAGAEGALLTAEARRALERLSGQHVPFP